MPDARNALVVAGLGVAAVAVSPLLAGPAHRTLTGHMVQHIALLSVAGPLLGAGLALEAPAGWCRWPRRAMARAISPRGYGAHTVAGAVPTVEPVARTATALVVLAVAHTAIVAGWHVPWLYDAANRLEPLHAAEHLSLLIVAALFWGVLVHDTRHCRLGLALPVLFVAGLPLMALGVALTLSTHPWYAPYASRPDAVHDQQLAGVVMWAYGGLGVILGAIALFALWLVGVERAETASQRVEVTT